MVHAFPLPAAAKVKHARAPHHHRVAAKKPPVKAVTLKNKPVAIAAAGTAAVLPEKPPALSRADILSSDASRLERVGRRIITGFATFAEVAPLVDKRAIAGIFITKHNVEGRTAAEIKAEIDKLQAVRQSQALPPLIVAADQEGGTVSRLSPPLKYQPSLARILAKLDHDEERKAAVTAYAASQASELKRIGVTLNFAPVVDLNIPLAGRESGETNISARAISSDPYLVTKVGTWYCDELAKAGIMCTLKHFPGLGRAGRDTHVAAAEISASEGKLELNDWLPFRSAMTRPYAATMLGHARIAAIDNTAPASCSKPVIAGLIRGRWQYEGLLITDDLSMGAITNGGPGLAKAAVTALNAGVDLILISSSETSFDSLANALIAADSAGELDAAEGEKSHERLRQRTDRSTWAVPQ